MGLFNLLSPVFGAIDGLFAPWVPAIIRVALWAAVLSVATMLLYKGLSPQAKIGTAKREAREARRELNSFDGEFADAGPLVKRQFMTAFRHIGLVLPGTILAVLPLLCFLVWADNHMAHRLPAPGAAAPAVTSVPAGAGIQTQWQATGETLSIRVTTGPGQTHDYPMVAPITVIAHRSAWNWLVGNPLGYLPDNAPAEVVRIALPERTYLTIGPSWMRGWLAIFIPVMFIVSLGMFRWAKIE